MIIFFKDSRIQTEILQFQSGKAVCDYDKVENKLLS